MNVGTKSLLFGVHQFLWHPLTVYRAWVSLYGQPTWRELFCIVIHDIGYFGAPNMDGEEGTRHPELGARIAGRLFGFEYYRLVLHHSRHYVKQTNAENFAFYGYAAAVVKESKLCWADKLSILYDPPWFYMLRGRLSGEIQEYRQKAAQAGFVPLEADDWTWYWWVRDKLITLAQTMDPASVPYMPNGAPHTKGA